MSWAQRRKATYIVSILFVFLSILAVILYFALNKTPTCFDSIKNQNEVGVDCGGSCVILCREQYINPVVIWGPRPVKILGSGLYNFLTYLQNPNSGVGAYNVPYTFKVYDNKDLILFQKTGMVYIPSNNNFVILEDNINLYDKVPARTTIEFTGNPVWQKIESSEASITAVSKTLLNEYTRPKLLVTMKNNTIKPIQNIEAIAILYDENNNAVAFSRTKIDVIDGNSAEDISFTWPEKFDKKIVRIDVVSKVLPK